MQRCWVHSKRARASVKADGQGKPFRRWRRSDGLRSASFSILCNVVMAGRKPATSWPERVLCWVCSRDARDVSCSLALRISSGHLTGGLRRQAMGAEIERSTNSPGSSKTCTTARSPARFRGSLTRCGVRSWAIHIRAHEAEGTFGSPRPPPRSCAPRRSNSTPTASLPKRTGAVLNDRPNQRRNTCERGNATGWKNLPESADLGGAKVSALLLSAAIRPGTPWVRRWRKIAPCGKLADRTAQIHVTTCGPLPLTIR